MRNRRDRARKGRDELLGSFANVFADAAKSGVTADEIRAQLKSLRIRPVITAHPTEAKRVTVLEKHRRIYLLLEISNRSRWTDRERADPHPRHRR